jgi:hypothetical protein
MKRASIQDPAHNTLHEPLPPRGAHVNLPVTGGDVNSKIYGIRVRPQRIVFT